MASSSNQKGSSTNSGFSVSMRHGVLVGSRGMPNVCRCGEALVIKTSGTTKNPGRLFHCCPKGSEKDNYHLFKWTDESMVEEIEDMKEKVNCFEKDIEDMKNIFRGYEKEMEAMKTEIHGCEKEVKEMVREILFLKSMFMCGVVVMASYYFWA